MVLLLTPFQAAQKLLEHSACLSSTNTTILLSLGDVESNLRRPENALGVWGRALEIDSSLRASIHNRIDRLRSVLTAERWEQVSLQQYHPVPWDLDACGGGQEQHTANQETLVGAEGLSFSESSSSSSKSPIPAARHQSSSSVQVAGSFIQGHTIQYSRTQVEELWKTSIITVNLTQWHIENSLPPLDLEALAQLAEAG